jgi:TonB-dependent SusC/RagA subfamily outer membrane receptor
MNANCGGWSLLRSAAIATLVTLLPGCAVAQVTDQSQRQPLIVVDGVVLQDGTVIDREAVLRIIGPAIASIDVLKGPVAAERFGAAAADGVIVIRLKGEFARPQAGVSPGGNRDVVMPSAPGAPRMSSPLVIVDGVVIPSELMEVLRPDDIENIEVLKGGAAIEAYGERGRSGVIHITTRRRQPH